MVLSFLAPVSTTARAQVRKDAAELQVNTYTTHGQDAPAVATLHDDQFIVVWHGANPDHAQLSGIRAQRFLRDGAPLGTEFLVTNQATTNGKAEIFPAVAARADGSFVVAWASYYSRDESDVGTQLFDAQGNHVTGQVAANSSADDNWLPAVAMDAARDFVVAWTNAGTLANYRADTRLRMFDPSGQKTGTEIDVSTSDLPAPSTRVAMKEDGESLVVYGGGDIRGQRIALSGAAIGTEFVLNSATAGYQGRPDIAAQGATGFVVVWESYGEDASGLGIIGQRLAADGTRVGDPFQVNQYTSNQQALPAIAVDAQGGFVVAWVSYDDSGAGASQDRSGRGVFGRAFNPDGTPRGSEFQVNAYTSGNQGHLRLQDIDVAAYSDGDFVIVWPSNGQDGDYTGVFAQRFDLDLTLGPLCGDAAANDLRVRANDALAALRAAVSLDTCLPCICDANSSGTVTAGDALVILRAAVSTDGAELTCSPCAS